MLSVRTRKAALVAAPILFLATGALAQETGQSPGFLDNLFGSRSAPAQGAAQNAEARASELAVEVDRLQAQVRRLTGQVEQLQFRNQQLEQQLQQQGGAGAAQRVAPLANAAPMNVPPRNPLPPAVAAPPLPAAPMAPQAPMQSSARSDVFDPSQNPGAPGAPRMLGSIPANAGPPPMAPPAAVSGGDVTGAPLDLSTLSGAAAAPPRPGNPALLPPPPPRNTSATGAQVASVAPPSQSPKDMFALARGYMERKDYALAENEFRDFLRRYPRDGLAPEANYWLGESLFQRKQYRDAAKAFLTVTTDYSSNAKAPDALLRLGQSLAALGEKQTACSAWGEIDHKYSHAPAAVKRSVAAEQKRVHC
ncbi:MAG TPA: tol-pal system protein YbgF [Xanthobacteraceae bacterium]|nr:tol-pal system protein YbgF [Xanthobacteraceae bacterium]